MTDILINNIQTSAYCSGYNILHENNISNSVPM